MKKALIALGILLLVGGGVFIYLNFSKKEPIKLADIVKPSGTAWKYDKVIAEPITATGGKDTAVDLGDINKDKATVSVPKDSLDTDTQISLATPDSVPNYNGEVIDTIGAPIEISAGGNPTRLNEKATITFSFDKNALPAGTVASELRIAYYDGSTWDYIKPLSIDLDKGIATFETYHFSLFGLNHIKDKTEITEEWIHSKTLDDKLKEELNKKSDYVTNQIIDLTLQKMGINDKSLKGKILGEVLKNDSYKSIYDSYDKGDVVALNQKISLLCGKKIAELVPKSVYQEALKGLTGSKDDVAAVSKAAGYAMEGQYEDAARIIGEQIADKFLITTAGKIAVEVVNAQINSWKNSEVEAAYDAFKNGADGHFWGYNVDKGDFNSVWDQMRGIRRQLEIEAIAKENAVRHESGMPELTEAQMDMVREGVKDSFQRQFENRLSREDEFDKREEQLRKIMDGFKKAGFFDSAGAPVGLDKGLDYENMLDVLGHFADKIMSDTNRANVSDKTGLIMTDAISVDDIVQGARIYFSGPDGKKDYAKFLKDRFNIDLYPKLSDLAGSWKGTTVITDIIFQASEEELQKAKEQGCDLSKLEEAKGKSNPLEFTLTPTSESGGDFGSGGKSTPFTYADGILSMSSTEKDATGTMTLAVSQDASAYVASGTMTVDYQGGKIKIIMSVNASKGKTASKTD